MLLGAAVAIARAAAPDPGPSPTDLAALDGFAAGMNVAGKFDGVVLVAKDGRPLFQKAYGLRDAARELPTEVDTRFNLASAGKMFTAVAILQQVAAGSHLVATDDHGFGSQVGNGLGLGLGETRRPGPGWLPVELRLLDRLPVEAPVLVEGSDVGAAGDGLLDGEGGAGG